MTTKKLADGAKVADRQRAAEIASRCYSKKDPRWQAFVSGYDTAAAEIRAEYEGIEGYFEGLLQDREAKLAKVKLNYERVLDCVFFSDTFIYDRVKDYIENYHPVDNYDWIRSNREEIND